MATACFTCDGDCSNSKRRRNLSRHVQYPSGVKFGEVLRMMGVNVRQSNAWAKRACCRPCWRLVDQWVTIHRRVEMLSQQWELRTGSKLPTLKKGSGGGPRFKRKAVRLIERSKYEALMRLLKRCSAPAKQAWRDDLNKVVQKEMARLSSMRNLFPTTDTEASTFKWENVIRNFKSTAPTVFAVLKGTLLKDASRSMEKHEESRLGAMMMIALRHRRPRCHRFVPSLLTASLRNWGTNGKVARARRSRRSGVGQSVRTAQCVADKPAKENDSNLQELCEAVQCITDRPTNNNDRDLQDWCETIQTECQEGRNSGTELHPSFAVVIDNVQQLSQTYHGGKSEQNEMRPECSGFAIQNRVSFRHFDDTSVAPASRIPMDAILPLQDDYERLRQRVNIIVQRILVNNLACFAEVADCVPQHIPHQYSTEAAQKSKCVSLGIFNENPSTAVGMMKIMSQVGENVPDGFHIPLHGDYNAVEMAYLAKVECSTLTPGNQLCEFQPVPQEFRLRSLLIKDTIDELYTPTRLREDGTLRQLQNLFGHASVDKAVSSFSHTDDFLLLVCCLLVVGMALHHLNISTCEDALPTECGNKVETLTRTAAEVVSQVWNQLSMNCVADIINAPVDSSDDKFCVCNGEIQGVDMIECGNLKCSQGRWFHRSCIASSHTTEEGEWFCSSACEHSGQTTYCLCRTRCDDALSLTCAHNACPRGRRFHRKCVGSRGLGSNDGSWYCSFQCLEQSEGATENVDHLLLYLEACAWRCLLNEALRDAEREGDGLAMMSHWRLFFPELFQKEHTEYLWATHRLLTGISGCFPERVRNEVIHNRTVNFTGGPGKNVSFGCGQEHMNKDNKGCTHQTSDRNSRKATRRAAKISGAVENLRTSNGCDGSSTAEKEDTPRFELYKEDVSDYFRLSKPDNLFTHVGGRCIPSMMNFHYQTDLTSSQAQQMKEKIIALNEDVDFEMEMGARPEER